MIRPFRFLCSPKYREQKQKEWESSKFRKIMDITSSAIAATLFAGAVWFWTAFFTTPKKPVKEIPPTHVTVTRDQTGNSNTTFSITMHLNVEVYWFSGNRTKPVSILENLTASFADEFSVQFSEGQNPSFQARPITA